LINLELKINSIERHQKLIIEKLPIANFKEEEGGNIDIFQDLPLQTQNDVETIETKLVNNKIYRSQMVSSLILHINSILILQSSYINSTK